MAKKQVDGLKRMPLVVIPKRKKHKDYVSRRRNPQLLANLRKCTSDPYLYRSYNNWSKLCFNDNKSERASPSIQSQSIASTTTFKESAPAKTEVDNKKKISLIPSSPRSGRKILNRVNPVPPPKKPETDSNREEDSLKKIVLKKATGGPSNVDESSKATQKLDESNPNLERKASAKKRRAEEFDKIKKELRESAKLPQLKSIPKTKEASDDAKAKKTLNEVAAAFSNIEAPQTSALSTTSTKATGNTNSSTTSNNAAKPPASPLTGRRRFNNDNTRLGHPSNQLTTSNIKLKNVAPAQAVNVTPSSSEFLTPVEPSPASSTEEKNADKSGQSSGRPNHSLAVPPESPQTSSRSKKFIEPDLAERLQLDPHVLAKIDKIISGGGKKVPAGVSFNITVILSNEQTTH